MEATYQPSGKTTFAAVGLMAAAALPAALAGLLAFAVFLLLSWLVGYLAGGTAALLHSLSAYLNYLVWEAWVEAEIPFHLVLDLVLLALAWLATILGWVCDLLGYVLPPFVALGGPWSLGWAVGGLVTGAGRLGRNRNVVAPAFLAGLTALAASLLACALAFPDFRAALGTSRLWAPDGHFLQLDRMLGSTLAAWLVVGIGLVLSVGGALTASIQGVREAAFCEGCNVYLRARTSPRLPASVRPALAEAIDRRDFERLPGLVTQVSPSADAYCQVRLCQCPGCGGGFLAASAYSPEGGGTTEVFRSVAVTRGEVIDGLCAQWTE